MNMRHHSDFFVVVTLLSFTLNTPTFGQQSLQQRTLLHNGLERVYFVHYPMPGGPAGPKPLVFVLHGGGGADAQEMAKRTGMNRLADRENFIVVYPYGIEGQWNDGRGKAFRRVKDHADVDDVGFIAAVIDALVGNGQADPARVYVMGLSNGGMMTYRLGIELGDRLAAIAAVIANLPENISGRKPVRPLSVLIMNGTDDPMMPWNGGSVRVLGKEYGNVLSTDRTVRYWADAAQLPLAPITRVLEDRFQEDRCLVETEEYRERDNPVEVVLYRIKGGGHQLPGGDTPDRPLLLGRKCLDINGPEVIWSFFKKHSLQQANLKENQAAVRKEAAAWRPKVKRVGDPLANYLKTKSRRVRACAPTAIPGWNFSTSIWTNPRGSDSSSGRKHRVWAQNSSGKGGLRDRFWQRQGLTKGNGRGVPRLGLYRAEVPLVSTE